MKFASIDIETTGLDPRNCDKASMIAPERSKA